MEILKSDIKKYKELIKNRFGLDIDDETARRELPLLVRQMEIFYKPIKKKKKPPD